MSKKKKKSGKNHSLEKLVLATATLNLIKTALDVIQSMLD